MLDDTPLPSPLEANRPDGTAAPITPAPEVTVSSLAKDVDDGSWHAVLDFPDLDGEPQREIVPRAMLNNASALADELAKRGCRLPPDRQGQLALARKLAVTALGLAVTGCVSSDQYNALKLEKDRMAEQLVAAQRDASTNKAAADSYNAQLDSLGASGNTTAALVANLQQQNQKLKVQATPTLVFVDGSTIPGAIPAEQIDMEMDRAETAQAQAGSDGKVQPKPAAAAKTAGG